MTERDRIAEAVLFKLLEREHMHLGSLLAQRPAAEAKDLIASFARVQAGVAYDYADAMLAKRDEGNEPPKSPMTRPPPPRMIDNL